jgi:hypothetical protein
VFKVEYFLYIIQIMLQCTPSFNKVCKTLRLQGCFLKLNIMQVRGDTSRIYALGGSFIHFVGFITAWKKTLSHRTFSRNYSLTEEDHTAVL